MRAGHSPCSLHLKNNIGGKQMNKKKLENYSLTASIHTVGLRSEVEPILPTDSDIVQSSCRMQKTGRFMVRLNPNKLHGDIFAYSEFCATMHEISQAMQIIPTYYRCDIRLDSYEYNFEEFFKLQLLLISLLSLVIHDPNGHPTVLQLTGSKAFTGISTKTQFWQAIYYDKAQESHDTDPAKARLELRALKMTNNDGYEPREIKEKWFEKLDKLPEQYERLQEKTNDALHKAYLKYVKYNGKSDRKRDILTSFLSAYNNGMTIFTRKQLRSFLMKCGLKETAANSRADYIIDRLYLEFFSRADIKRYIKKIKDAMNDFFEC